MSCNLLEYSTSKPIPRLRSHQLPVGRWHFKSLLLATGFLLLVVNYFHSQIVPSDQRTKRDRLVIHAAKPYKSLPYSRRRHSKGHKIENHEVSVQSKSFKEHLPAFQNTSAKLKKTAFLAAAEQNPNLGKEIHRSTANNTEENQRNQSKLEGFPISIDSNDRDPKHQQTTVVYESLVQEKLISNVGNKPPLASTIREANVNISGRETLGDSTDDRPASAFLEKSATDESAGTDYGGTTHMSESYSRDLQLPKNDGSVIMDGDKKKGPTLDEVANDKKNKSTPALLQNIIGQQRLQDIDEPLSQKHTDSSVKVVPDLNANVMKYPIRSVQHSVDKHTMLKIPTDD